MSQDTLRRDAPLNPIETITIRHSAENLDWFGWYYVWIFALVSELSAEGERLSANCPGLLADGALSTRSLSRTILECLRMDWFWTTMLHCSMTLVRRLSQDQQKDYPRGH